jgi:DNA-binding MarR family transcriptional regulator
VTVEAVLAAIAKRPESTRGLQMIFNLAHAKPLVVDMLERLERKGLIRLTQGKNWELTPEGYAFIQRTPEPRPWKPYEPPKIVRRPGSDRASKIPSRF